MLLGNLLNTNIFRAEESTKEKPRRFSSVGNCFLNVCDLAVVDESFQLLASCFVLCNRAESFVPRNLGGFGDSPNCLERLLDCLENEPLGILWIKIFIEQSFRERIDILKRSLQPVTEIIRKNRVVSLEFTSVPEYFEYYISIDIR